jgi:hypothetical protein
MAGYIGSKAVSLNVTSGDILGDVGVGGDVTVGDDLSVTDDATIGGTLDVTGAVDMASTLDVGSTLTVKAPSNAEAIHVIGRSDDIGQILFLEADASTYLARVDARNNAFNIQAMPNIPMNLGVNSATNVTIETDGDLSIADGNLVVAAGHGINFAANTNINSGAASELFECYEYGFYTATMTPSTSGSVTLNSGVDTLSYTKIGQIVHIQGLLETSGKSSPVGSQLRVTLPVAIIDSSEYSGRVGGGIMFNNGNGAAPTVIPFSGVEGGTVVNFIMDASTVHPGGSPAYSQWYIDFSYTAA